MNNNEYNYDDHNYYFRFIESQLEWRRKTQEKEYFKLFDRQSILYEFSIINACGLRATGATTAISNLFNPETDLYVGPNDSCCKEFKILLNKRFNKEIDNYSYLNFKTVNFDNTNVKNQDIVEKIENFFENNNLEILQIQQSNCNKNKIRQLDISEIKDQLVREIMYTNVDDIPRSIRGKETFKNGIVYIDIGSYYHREYSVRINRLINYIYSRVRDKNDILFVLT